MAVTSLERKRLALDLRRGDVSSSISAIVAAINRGDTDIVAAEDNILGIAQTWKFDASTAPLMRDALSGLVRTGPNSGTRVGDILQSMGWYTSSSAISSVVNTATKRNRVAAFSDLLTHESSVIKTASGGWDRATKENWGSNGYTYCQIGGTDAATFLLAGIETNPNNPVLGLLGAHTFIHSPVLVVTSRLETCRTVTGGTYTFTGTTIWTALLATGDDAPTVTEIELESLGS